MEDRNNINEFRKKTKQRKFLFRLSVIVLIALTALLVAINWGKIIAPLKDAALDVGVGGFPVDLPGSTGYKMDKLGENFFLLTDTYLYTYNNEGANIASIQHGFQNPVSTSADKRLMIYDRGGKGIKFYSKTSEVYSKTLDDTIVFAQMGNKERCAVVTTSTRYFNFLYVFNGEGRQIFRWSSPENKIMQVCFSDDDSTLYASVLGEENGELSLSIIRINIDAESDNIVWQTYIGSEITYSLEYTSGGIYAVTGGGSVLLDKDSGEISKQAFFAKTIVGIPESNGMHAVIFLDSGSNSELVITYNDSLEPDSTLSPAGVTAFDVSGGKLYLLVGNRLEVYNSKLELTKEYELDDVYSDVKIIDGSAFLLGYNTVQRVKL